MRATKYIFVTIIVFTMYCTSLPNNGANEIMVIANNLTNREKILWSSTDKLKWSDFKGRNTTSFGLTKAETTTIILVTKTYYNDEYIPVYEIACYFLPKQSWTITSEKFALEHEQLHFDIAELYTRKIRKTFDSLKIKKVKDFDKYENVFKQLNKKSVDYNILYDSEVYGINEEGNAYFNYNKQREWIDKVGKELEALKDYEYNATEAKDLRK